ncbi:MAG: hypothetical protein ACYS8L_09040 [Planctomycetota bacterium]
MAEALLTGMLKAGVATAEGLYASDPFEARTHSRRAILSCPLRPGSLSDDWRSCWAPTG